MIDKIYEYKYRSVVHVAGVVSLRPQCSSWNIEDSSYPILQKPIPSTKERMKPRFID